MSRGARMWSPLIVVALLGVAQGPSVLSNPNEPFERIWQGRFSQRTESAPALKLLNWNIERGAQFPAIREAIRELKPDLCLLQEVDLDARRTHRRHVAEELARTLGLNYLFGVEFQELSQGSRSSPAYHGQAILTSLPIRAQRILRFVQQSDDWRPRKYLPNLAIVQPRLGGRMALIAELQAGGFTVVVYNTHLESRGSEDRRLEQLEEILSDTSRYPPDTPIVLAGDLNTQDASPLIGRLREAGFRNAMGPEPVATTLRGGTKDWIFVRGPIRFDDGKVHQDIAASDHFPLSVRLFVTGSQVGAQASDRLPAPALRRP